MQHRFLVLVSLMAACGYAAACGGADSTDLDGCNDATTADGANDTSPSGDSGGADVTPGNDAGIPDGGCTKGTPGCRACCAAQYPDAAALFETTEETCACTTPGDCKTECANSLCKGLQPQGQPACEACVFNKDAGGCFGVAAQTCAADTECQKFAGCVAGCGGGPTDAGGGG